MRTNIVIDEKLMADAMKAGPYKTKKDAVEAGLKLLARQAAYREILKWEGKLHWDDSDVPAKPRIARKPSAPAKPPVGQVAAKEPRRNGRR
jgi:antitoxin ParD1/3/4